MSANINTKTESLSSKQKWNRILLIPIILSIALLPLLVSEYTYDPKLSSYGFFASSGEMTDFFLHCKQNFFIAMGVIMLFVIICKLCIDYKKLRFVPIFIPLFLYGFMALLSTLTSKYRSYSISGSYEQFESIFVLLTYCMIVYYTFITVQYETDIKLILHALFISVLILSILGLTQVTSHDFLRTTVGQKLYIKKVNWKSLSDYKFNFELNRVYLTLYNPNYVGVYASLVIPILIALIYFSKKLITSLFYIIALIGIAICMIGSKSTASLLSILVALIFLIILLRKQIVHNLIITIPAAILAISLVVACCMPASPIYMLNKLKTSDKPTFSLESVYNNEEGAFFVYNGNTLQVQFTINNKNEILFGLSDGDKNKITDYTIDDQGVLTISDPRFNGIKVIARKLNDDLLGFEVNINNIPWIFTNQLGDKSYHYFNCYGKESDIVPSNQGIFKNNPTFASNRGYIWSQTLPLLKDHIFLGSGPDTFVFDFPYKDYVMLNNLGFYGSQMTKPHSLYLQVATQTGMISLIAFLVFYILYFISSIRLYIRSKFESYYEISGVAIFLGTISYMICGITNDSSICVSPVFWGLMGVGIAINFKLLKENKTIKTI